MKSSKPDFQSQNEDWQGKEKKVALLRWWEGVRRNGDGPRGLGVRMKAQGNTTCSQVLDEEFGFDKASNRSLY